MTAPLWHDRQRRWIEDLLRLVRERNQRQAEIELWAAAERDAAEREAQQGRQKTQKNRDQALGKAEVEWRLDRESIEEHFEAERRSAEETYARSRRQIMEESEAQEEKLREALQERVWTANSLFDAAEKDARSEMHKSIQLARETVERATRIWTEVEQWLRGRGVAIEQILPRSTVTISAETVAECRRFMVAQLEAAESAFGRLQRLIAPKLLTLSAGVVLYLVFVGIASLPSLFQKPPLLWLVGGWFTGSAAFALFRAAVEWIGTRQMLRRGEQIARLLEKAESAADRCKTRAEADFQTQLRNLRDKLHREQHTAQSEFQPRLDMILERRVEALRDLHKTHEETLRRLREQNEAELAAIQERRATVESDAERVYQQAMAAIEQRYGDRLRDLERIQSARWQELNDRWQHGIGQLRQEHAELNRLSDEWFPPWNSAIWEDFPPKSSVPRGIRLGDHSFDLARIPQGEPRDSRLHLDRPFRGRIPAFLPFPERGGLLLKAQDEGRSHAVAILQNLMLRFLSALPPGKVRFTIIDPVGLGDNFAEFMHLADYDELLVTNRIWTESAQIEQRLADLNSHMENVIQKYLRREFRTIEDYNAAAGEVAEPYRVLVIANFPVNFTVEAARRLVSIVNSGASCGVFALVSVDTRQPVPHGFQLSDLEAGSWVLLWRNQAFEFRDDIFNTFPFQPEAPPPPELASRVIRHSGALAKTAGRVEVPFDFVMPPEDQWWHTDSRKGIVVPIGRSGATKRQSLDLGRGTAQHGLIAGKTGSGKSTLLHAIITNLSLIYSPDEVELYLIDFKKGVEFKLYAEMHLPHARVIAIESEREFGLSVLQRLDQELRVRGDLFRQAGVTDISAYREARPNERMPRILLIVDEFQEFFIEEDKLAQEASLLLDRLVRQGRAFGMHVLLGSQTLGGAYSLARATIDQMAVRIALQCSEADAHLILSKDNSAARLLTRPGEAIYNDANGLVEGNDVFQVVWLPDDRRLSLLQALQSKVGRDSGRRPPLVFEGNAPADIERNHVLMSLLLGSAWPEQPKSFSAWLGDAVAIKDPTAAIFRPQSGSHLILIGQQEDTALALVASSLISLAAQHRPDPTQRPTTARFLILDGTLVDDPNEGYLAALLAALPHQGKVLDSWEIASTLAELTDLIDSRQSRRSNDRTTHYVLIHGLQRFRDLRRPEDDYSFGRSGTVSPAQNFATIVREGPAVGVHLIMWCDTLVNLHRIFDRTMLRECTQRVLFQMSATDSAHLIDSPLASRLGRHRALFHREEMEQPEKFRPYALPSRDWIARVGRQLSARHTMTDSTTTSSGPHHDSSQPATTKAET